MGSTKIRPASIPQLILDGLRGDAIYALIARASLHLQCDRITISPRRIVMLGAMFCVKFYNMPSVRGCLRHSAWRSPRLAVMCRADRPKMERVALHRPQFAAIDLISSPSGLHDHVGAALLLWGAGDPVPRFRH